MVCPRNFLSLRDPAQRPYHAFRNLEAYRRFPLSRAERLWGVHFLEQSFFISAAPARGARPGTQAGLLDGHRDLDVSAVVPREPRRMAVLLPLRHGAASLDLLDSIGERPPKAVRRRVGAPELVHPHQWLRDLLIFVDRLR